MSQDNHYTLAQSDYAVQPVNEPPSRNDVATARLVSNHFSERSQGRQLESNYGRMRTEVSSERPQWGQQEPDFHQVNNFSRSNTVDLRQLQN